MGKLATWVSAALVALLVCAGQADAGTLIQVSGGVWYEANAGEVDDLRITMDASERVVVTANRALGVTTGLCTSESATRAVCGRNVHITLDLFDMDDHVVFDDESCGTFCRHDEHLAEAYGGLGDDHIEVTSAPWEVTARGGLGDDHLQSADVMYGDGGDDVLDNPYFAGSWMDGGGGADTMRSETGSATVSYEDRTKPLYVAIDNQPESGEAGEQDRLDAIGRVVGGSGNDVLIGGSRSEALQGRGGDDRLQGGPGGDELDGGDGSDTVDYDEGWRTSGVDASLNDARDDGAAGENDWVRGVEHLTGTRFRDDLEGNGGPNTLIAGDDLDALSGGGGDDVLDAGNGPDFLLGGDGDDILYDGPGGSGDKGDAVQGGPGVDTADYSHHAAALELSLDGVVNDGDRDGTGDTSSEGDALDGIENLTGGPGNDNLAGNAGANQLRGGAGIDTLKDGGGAGDLLDGGAGTADLADYTQRTANLTLILDGRYSSGAPLELDALVDIEVAAGGSGNDRLIGSAANESLYGFGGLDFLVGGLGDDLLDGGAGFDTLSYADGRTAGVTANLNTGAMSSGAERDQLRELEAIEGGPGDDRFTGDGGRNLLDGAEGSDTLDGGLGPDTLYDTGSGDIDTVTYAGRADDVRVEINTAADDGAPGEGDLVDGEPNAIERIVGGNGSDTLIGGTGDQTLDGGPGGDTLHGQGGVDTIDYAGHEVVLGGFCRGGVSVSFNGLADDGTNILLLENDNVGHTVERILGTRCDDSFMTDDIEPHSIDGREGSDTIDYSERAAGVEVTLDGAPGEGDRLTSVENAIGSRFADRLTGSEGANRLEGRGGPDVLDGRDGPDVLIGGTGRDSFDAGTGADLVDSRDDEAEQPVCGPDIDIALYDVFDHPAADCEGNSTVPPVSQSAPVVIGNAFRGVVLTASNGAWEGVGGAIYTYEFFACQGDTCRSLVPRGPENTYRVQVSDVGYTVRSQVTAMTPAGTTTSALSAPTAVIADDSTPPETGLDSRPATLVNRSTATFTYSSNEGGATFECDLDGAGFAACPEGSVTYTGLTSGPHTFKVRSIDPAGNADASPATAAWTIDTSATQLVSSFADLPDALADGVCDAAGPEGCTLRAAIQEANRNPAHDRIVFANRGRYELDPSAGQLFVANGTSLEIEGAGPDETVISAGGRFRVLFVNADVPTLVRLKNLRIADGFDGLKGAGIFSRQAQLELDRVAVTGNVVDSQVAQAGGAGIAAEGRLIIKRSTIAGNEVRAPFGTAAGIMAGGDVHIDSSTISGNKVPGDGMAGAIHLVGSGLPAGEIVNSTISGNRGGSADQNGVGGLWTANPIALRNVTFAENTGGVASLRAAVPGVTAENSIVPGCSGHPVTETRSLGCAFTGDARLTPLAGNGGATLTHGLRAGSPAIDAGAGCPDVDQRGEARPSDGDGDGTATCDIGAFELEHSALSVRIEDASATEGAPVGFKVKLSHAVVEPTTVKFETTDLGATAGSDYVARSEYDVVIPGGQTEATIAVITTQDDLYEHSENFGAALLAFDTMTYVFERQYATGTIVDDDPLPVLTVAPEAADEGSPVTFALTLSGKAQADVPVTLATHDGTATAPADYTARSGAVVTIPGGQTRASFAVATVQDTADEPDETFTVSLSAVGVETGTSSVTGTIRDNDAPPPLTIAVGAASGNEGDVIRLPLTLSEPAPHGITVNFTTSDGTATAPGDYLPRDRGEIFIEAGQTQSSIPIESEEDTVDEPDETVNVAIEGGAIAVATPNVVATILDDDGTPVVSIDPAAAADEGGPITFTARLSNPSSGVIRVFTTLRIDDFADIGTPPGEIVFAPGETAKPVTVLTRADALVEPDEAFSLELDSALGGATIGAGALATGTIYDPRLLTVEDAAADEGDDLAFVVSLNHPALENARVDLQTQQFTDDTATLGVDVDAQTVPVDFVKGATQAVARFRTREDEVYELDETTRAVVASVSANARLRLKDDAGRGTIRNDEPLPQINIAGAEVVEGGRLDFRITIDRRSSQPVTFTANTTGYSFVTAFAPDDFEDTRADLTIAPGQSQAIFSVQTVQDGLDETRESMSASVFLARGATLGPDDVVWGYILDDDEPPASIAPPVVTIHPARAVEGEPLRFKVELSGARPYPVEVSANAWEIAGRPVPNRADGGEDFSCCLPERLQFAPGEREKWLEVRTSTDNLKEGDELLDAHIEALTNATSATPSRVFEGAGTIVDDQSIKFLPGLAVSVVKVTGTVLFANQVASGAVLLKSGTKIDATKGSAVLEAVFATKRPRASAQRKQRITIAGGVVIFTQDAKTGLVTLALQGKCGSRRLTASTPNGLFAVRGQRGVATVRRGKVVMDDACKRSTVKVAGGSASVKPKRGKPTTVRAGRTMSLKG